MALLLRGPKAGQGVSLLVLAFRYAKHGESAQGDDNRLKLKGIRRINRPDCSAPSNRG
jgi:hypothetical protein